MKILELHIRNIASIEKADIDFEHESGLLDPETGLPSQMFLIYGDTGTGKTALLDAITMALFDTTPRLAGLPGAANGTNAFVSSNGNAVIIKQVQQYARIGIGLKDECYSEVVFEGNDKVVYHAKIQFTLKKKDLSVSKKNYLKVGDADWIDGVSTVKPMVEAAIGMTFEQFSRVAMLAQGEFTAFLCGTRDKRADILEKLTNTTIFTVYGNAIKSIYARKEAEFLKTKSALDEAKKHVLSDADVDGFKQAVEKSAIVMHQAKTEREKLEAEIKQLDVVLQNQKRIDQISTSLTDLYNKRQSDPYLNNKQLFIDWDNTDSQRADYLSIVSLMCELKAANAEMERCRNRFSILCGDLRWREAEMAKVADRLHAVGQWLDERKGFDDLYCNAALECERLARFKKDITSQQNDVLERDRLRTQLPELLKAADVAKKNSDDANVAVESKKKEMTELLAKRNALNPQQVNADIDKATSARSEMEALLRDWHTESELQEKVKQLSVEINDLTDKHKLLHAAFASAKEKHSRAHDAYELAMKNYSVMGSSVEEWLSELRARLVDTHAEVCPLCGSKLEGHIMSADDFEQILAPLKHAQEQAAMAEKESAKEMSARQKDVAMIEGEMKNKSVQEKQLEQEHRQATAVLNQALVRFGLSTDEDIEKAVMIRLKDIDSSIAELKAKLGEASNLQSQIDTMVVEVQKLESVRQAALTMFTNAQNSYVQSSDKVKSLNERIALMQQTIDAERRNLSDRLSSLLPEWHNDVDSAIATLRTQAKEYTDKKTTFQTIDTSLQQARTNFDAAILLRSELQSMYPQWPQGDAVEPLPPTQNPINEWNILANSCAAKQSIIQRHTESIDISNARLAAWTAESGKTLDYLRELVEKQPLVPQARKYVADVDNGIVANEAAKREAERNVAEARAALHLADTDTLPDRDVILAKRNNVLAIEEEARRQNASAQTSLDNNSRQSQLVVDAEAANAVAKAVSDHWRALDKTFGGDKFRNIVQTHILRPLLNNANVYLHKISPRYTLTCDPTNEQLSILVLDAYNRNEVRSVAVLSGGERFIISLALSLALSSLNREGMRNVNILFIDEGFGTLDQASLDSVMSTLSQLNHLPGHTERRVGIISHREELLSCIPNKIRLRKIGEGRSRVDVVYEP